MARSQETWNKKEVRNNKEKKRKEKAKKKLEKKDNETATLDDMIAYVDEYGMITSTPPDPSEKKVIRAENIVLGVPKSAPVNPEDLIRHGVVVFYNDSKGYGFIRDLATQDKIFVHASGLTETIKEDNKVTFEVTRGAKGMNATDVKIEK